MKCWPGRQQQRSTGKSQAQGISIHRTDAPLEFCFLQGEVAGAFQAWRRSKPDAGEELADVALFLLSIAEMTGIDLQSEIECKMAKNSARVYKRDETSGILTRVAEGVSA